MRRVKVIEKRSHAKRYGQVGTIVKKTLDGRYLVRFEDSGEVCDFERDELRIGVKAHV